MSHAQNSKGRKNWAGSHPSSGLGSSSNNKKSALSAAYAELGKELTSGKLRSIGTYTLGRPIGEGTFGKVRLGTHRLTGVRVAIKQVPKAHSATLTREIHHHRRLHHPNIMQLYEVLASESYIWMVTELCPGGELYDYLVERGTMPEPEARRIFGQLCMAVAYIHNRGIVHRDLKLENVLLDERCNVKLGDFGFTREFESKKLMETFCGTTGYAAPEMLAGRRYTGEEVDVWSLGVILYALVCGTLPFDDDDDAIMKAKILKGDFELPDLISEECADLIMGILQQDPTARPTIKEILAHPWFTKTMAPMPMETVNEDVHDAEHFSSATDTDLSNSRFLTATSSLLATSPGEIKSSGQPKKVEDIKDEDLTHKNSSSGLSETSFFSAQSKSDSESSDRQSSHTQTTSPTTDGGDEDTRTARQIAEEIKPTFSSLSLKHRNESQTTIKRQTSASSDASRVAAVASSSKTTPVPLPTHIEGEPDQDDILAPIMALSAPLEKHSSQSSSSRGASGHHRTPSRTKRRSSGGLSDHHPPSLETKPIDYISLLEHSTPAIFSTVLEQNLLHQLSGLGMDVGQIVHSVVNEACDASGATWWILKKKAEEKLQQEHDQGLSPYMTTYTLAQAPTPNFLTNIDQSRARYDSTTSDRSQKEKGKSGQISPSPSQREMIRPTAIKASEALIPVDVSKSTEDVKKSRVMSDLPEKHSDSSVVPPASTSTPSKHRPSPSRNRASSFSVRLTHVLAGKDKESRTGDGETSIMIGNEQFEIEERSKSPVMPGFFSKKSERNSPSPASTPKVDKKKETKSPLRLDSKNTASVLNRNEVKNGNLLDEKRDQGSPTGSPKRKEKSSNEIPPDESDLKASKSFETFSTITSTTNEEDSAVSTNRKGKGPKSSFLHTVRNWLGTEDKNANGGNVGNTSTKKKKKRQSQTSKPPSSISQRPVQSASVKRTPSMQGFSPTGSNQVVRSGSIRRQAPSVAYSTASTGRSPRISQRGSISRRSSSGSVQYATLGQRPLNARRPSAGSITPTAGLGMEDYLVPVRHSRPSSAQSHTRPFGSLHTKSGSTGSFNSLYRLQSQGSGYSGSLRGIHARRPSVDGGTTVRRHRHYPHHARSDSLSRSRPSTPNRNSMILEDASMDTITPRRSLDLDYASRTSSLMHTPRANQPSVFVAHRSRTPYKPPSANPSLIHQQTNNDQSIQSNGLSGKLFYYGIQPPTAFGTWRRSWGKAPPSWAGPVDQQASVDENKSSSLFNNNDQQDTISNGKNPDKPKLRDIFANRESDDDWEDEDDEPMYAGGLGQLASSSWASDPSMSKFNSGAKAVQPGTPISKRNEGMPTSVVNSGKYVPIRNLFQPPSLGNETMPRTWIMSTSEDAKGETNTNGVNEIGEKEVKSSSSPLRKALPLMGNPSTNSLDLQINTIPEQPTKDNNSLSNSTTSPINSTSGSRMRSAAPTFKGPVTIEEEEEDE